jgi:hypothetical protein
MFPRSKTKKQEINYWRPNRPLWADTTPGTPNRTLLQLGGNWGHWGRHRFTTGIRKTESRRGQSSVKQADFIEHHLTQKGQNTRCNLKTLTLIKYVRMCSGVYLPTIIIPVGHARVHCERVWSPLPQMHSRFFWPCTPQLQHLTPEHTSINIPLWTTDDYEILGILGMKAGSISRTLVICVGMCRTPAPMEKIRTF